MKESPLVSVLMPVYNAEKYLKEALESILNQSYTHFEFLLFNDGSTDGSKAIIDSFEDTRIHFFDYPENSGYLVYLNEGIRRASGKYIIRADADDINDVDRITKQVDFMENHPEVGLCGTWVKIIHPDGSIDQEIKYFAEDAWIRAHLFWTTAIIHPTVIIRKKILDEYNLFYKPEWYLVEDYALWLEISKYTKLANIQEALVQVRKHDHNISVTKNAEQAHKAKKIRFAQLSRLKIYPSPEEWEIHLHVLEGTHKIDLKLIKSLDLWLSRLLQQNQKIKAFPPEAFTGILQKHWYKHTLGYTSLGLGLWKLFVKSPLSDYQKFGLSFKIKFLIKALLRI